MDVSAVTTPSGQARETSKAEREQIAHLAQEFEAMFISEMMRGMRQSLLSEEEEGQGFGSETMTDTFDTEFGRSMSNAGGLGLARVMLEGLSKQLGVAGAATESASPSSIPAPAAASRMATFARSAMMSIAVPGASTSLMPGSLADAPDVTGEDALSNPISSRGAAAAGSTPNADVTDVSASPQARTLPGPVTSKFGWRADPFTGRPQFHAGTDVRLAYGHDVQSVAAGRVKSVDDQAGYGLTVVIDHGKGLETRYAHLSNASVKAGDLVDSGQVVARSGSSGRSTGPHLHLEARQNGRAVEMAALLKSSGMNADSYADDRSIVRSGHED